MTPRYFEWNKLMAKVRNPKPEIRRSPKGAVQRLQPQFQLVALVRTRLSEADASSIARRPRSLSILALLRRVDRLGFRISDFELLSDLRVLIPTASVIRTSSPP